MDVVGSEIGQKMRSAIKAKLTELGCYVDDELPDYVMVMVANKRTRLQMEDDLQLFLGDNTQLFVNWLHQVLKKLQEVTVTPPLNADKPREKSKEKKSKDKKDKDKTKHKKTDSVKKAKKKDKNKIHKSKKEERKAHKSKKKSKHHEMIHPNVPPLLMNMEKESEPSITDVFAGQILKKHGVTIESPKEEKVIDEKPIILEIKRPIIPIIDPSTIPSQSEPEPNPPISVNENIVVDQPTPAVPPELGAPREEQLKEMQEIEAKIIGLKQKLAEQLDSMSDDEDFLNIRTEAEELMNDFAEDVFQEISSQTPAASASPKRPTKLPSPPPPEPSQIPKEVPKEIPKVIPKEPEELPQIELKLPKRSIRERLGARGDTNRVPEKKAPEEQKKPESPERFTPDKDPDFWGKNKSARSRLGSPPESSRKSDDDKSDSGLKRDASPDPDFWGKSKSARSRLGSLPESSRKSDDSDKSDSGSKRTSSPPSRRACLSVVRVRPRPRAAPSLLLRAVADAHKSLRDIPPKVDTEPKVKRAMVLPMRRCVDARNIVVQVPTTHADRHDDEDKDKTAKSTKDEKEEYIPISITKKFANTDYVPSRRGERSASRKDDSLVIETINIHNTTFDKDKKTQFIVTMDGFNPNAFLAKKLMTEGLLSDEQEIKDIANKPKSVLKTAESSHRSKTSESVEKNVESSENPQKTKARDIQKSDENTENVKNKTENKDKQTVEKDTTDSSPKPKENVPKKRLSDTSEESDTQVIINNEVKTVKRKSEEVRTDKRKSEEVKTRKSEELKTDKRESEEVKTRKSEDLNEQPVVKKRRASPIVFNVKKNVEEKKKERERTESASSDTHVVVSTNTNSHKYDSLPPLSVTTAATPAPPADRRWCRAFPLCRFGASCLFAHPRCKFAAACTRRACPYSHPARHTPKPQPVIASHVVPVANFKSISTSMPTVCKFYPHCANPTCAYYHPKPCRYGKDCSNGAECNFYHGDHASKWRYPV